MLEVRNISNLHHEKGVGGTDIINWVEVANTETCRPGGATVSHMFHQTSEKKKMDNSETSQSQYAWMSTTFISTNDIINNSGHCWD